MNINTEQVFLVNSAELDQSSLHTDAPLQRSFAMPVDAVHPEGSQSSSVCHQSLEPPSRSQMCRLCATDTELVVPIFEGEGLQNGLADKINQHLPIRVSEKDLLPVVLCFQCTSTVLAWHELVLCCVQADQAMRERFHHSQPQQLPVQSSQPEVKKEKYPHNQFKIIKSTMTEYLQSIDMDDQAIIVCQKCDNPPRLTLENFTDHLVYKHDLDTFDKNNIVSFIRDNITFEEALVFDTESNMSADTDSSEMLDESATPRHNLKETFQHIHAAKGLDKSDIQFVEDQDMDESEVVNTTDEQSAVSLPTLLCPHCDSAFSSATRLTHHLGTHMDLSIEHGVQCCDVTYHTNRDFVAHLQEKHVNRLIYDPENMCKSCSFRADTGQQLKAHIQKCHNEEIKPKKKLKESAVNQKFIPAVCPECNEVYSNKYNMMMHMKSHLRREVFECDRCGKEYSTKGNLSQHVRLAHEGSLPHACGACGERFPTRSARDNHSRLHTGEKPFRCEICGASFRANNTLLRHLDIHLGVRNHQCQLCHKRFHKWSQLTAHARVHRRRNQ